MERMTLSEAVNEISQAMAVLENAKSDCKEVIESTLDAYFGEGEDSKEAKAARRTEAKNIKKLAKAMLKGEKEAEKEAAENMQNLIEELG